eukprot:scaffold169603_cov25-Prasinocladus_malaysianus.AAC.1
MCFDHTGMMFLEHLRSLRKGKNCGALDWTTLPKGDGKHLVSPVRILFTSHHIIYVPCRIVPYHI